MLHVLGIISVLGGIIRRQPLEDTGGDDCAGVDLDNVVGFLTLRGFMNVYP
jgi:hypothetical protein